jgi:hypothetical protein
VAGRLEKEIDALLLARTEQIPAWHEAMSGPGDEPLSIEQGLDLLYGMIRVHMEVIRRLAREIDHLTSAQNPDT